MEEYRRKYDRIVKAKPFCILSLAVTALLYVMSVVMAWHSDAYMIQHIRKFSFPMMAVCFFGVVYLILFTRNFKVNYDYTKIDQTAFLTNVRYAGFGIFLCLACLPMSLIWIITLCMSASGPSFSSRQLTDISADRNKMVILSNMSFTLCMGVMIF